MEEWRWLDVECDKLMSSEDTRSERIPQTRDAGSLATVMVGMLRRMKHGGWPFLCGVA